MSCEKRRVMNLDLNSMDRHRNRTMSLSDLLFDELLSPVKSASPGNCRSVASSTVTTPTPTQFLFPTSVTAEQEAYASGFVRALEELHRSEGQCATKPTLVDSADYSPTQSSQLITLNNVPRFNSFAAPPSYSQAIGIGSGIVWPGSKLDNIVRSLSSPHVQPVKSCLSYLPTADCFDSLSTVRPLSATSPNIFTQFPRQASSLKVVDNHNGGQRANWHTMMPVSAACSLSTGAGNQSLSAAADSTVSCPPTKVDMDEQDHWRLERKRAKNRVAAARCQMRKVERISGLQEKVQELRDNNARLARTVAELTNHVSTLRKQILMHTERGCRMMIPALS